MPKRSAKEAFGPKKPVSAVSAFAAARAKKAAIQDGLLDGHHTVSAEGPIETAKQEEITASAQLHEELRATIHGADLDTPVSRFDQNPPLLQDAKPLSKLGDGAVKIYDDTRVELKMTSGEIVTCEGMYDLTIEEGLITIYGATLGPGQTHRIYAPSIHALPSIQARSDPCRIWLSSVTSADSLKPKPSGLPQLASLSPLWSRMQVGDDQRTFRIVYDMEGYYNARSLTALDIDAEAQQLLNRLGNSSSKKQTPPVILVVGSKGSGKSTFGKLLLNTTLTSPARNSASSCFWLDLDPGQPEFGAPCQVSLVQIRQPLFGPSYTHSLTHPALPYRTVRSHAIGATSLGENQDHYLQCVQDLLKTCLDIRQRSSPQIPVIINSTGWTSGSGAAIIGKILDMGRTTDVVLLEVAGVQSDDLVAAITATKLKANVTTLFTPPRSAVGRPAPELRAMQTMSYFHSARTSDQRASWIPQPLNTLNSWLAPYAGADKIIDGVMAYHTYIDPSILCIVLTGMPVFLVVTTDVGAMPQSHRNDQTKLYGTEHTHQQIPLIIPPTGSATAFQPLDPAHSHCLGQAIIKHVDMEQQTFRLMTPVERAEVHLALQPRKDGSKPRLVLVKGKMDSPDWYFTEEHYHRSATEMLERRSAGQSDLSGFDLSPYSSDADDDRDRGETEDATQSLDHDLKLALGLDPSASDDDEMQQARPLLDTRGKTKSTKLHRLNAAADLPYVSFVTPTRPIPGTDDTTGNGVDRESAAGRALSSKVWRARKLPRNK